jgi:hypothetical protein
MLSFFEHIEQYYYHGTRAIIPFQQFERNLDGTGLVSHGKRYGGFFFTSNKENAEFFTEWFVAKVSIKNIVLNPTLSTHPPTVLGLAVKNKKNYLLEDVVDGHLHSDVVVVPHSNLNDITVVEWEFVGDKESYFESLDQMFETNDQYGIREVLETIGADINYLLKIPVFNQYYQTISTRSL